MRADAIDPKAALAALAASRLAAAKADARKLFDKLAAKRRVNKDNYCDYAEEVASRIVDKMGLQVENEDFAISVWHVILADLLNYAKV
jgi:hypothetical protein